ncbi:DNA polymerase III subunit alpha [Weissella tructae]|uniref:DNA polymerase III subunit alpha n=2 Tax=Weissella TaxID=46255 RepID=A0A075U6B9_9LACO|nr:MULTISPECIES: DNA polymerase III subunit alpha [Weissella]AIG65682.1 DNA-directed DNA polymerase [Weissella tructae]AIM62997.1 DNA-directed DNA polymerase [Weissella ceti]AIM64397.1 DNA-directed DNA polymerase [Weissella ceti]ELA06864.1 DNA polymerase III subunit alpha [Weissella ceti NC36]QVV90801.1 DNA polymerase III subunit alpha [Weissella tructae]
MTPLQTKSAFSLLESPMMPKTLVENAKQKGYTSVALTDTNVLYGMDAFYNAALAADIKPILGLTAQMQGLTMTQPFPFVLLVENQTGYRNLLHISSVIMSQTEPVTLESLRDHLAGLFVIVPRISELSLLLGMQSNIDVAGKWLADVQAIVPAGHLYLGVSSDMTDDATTTYRTLSGACDVPLVALDSVEYADPSDQFAAQVVTKIGQGEVLANIAASQKDTPNRYLASAVDSTERFVAKGLADAVGVADWIAENSHFEIEATQDNLPAVPLPEGQNATSYLAELAQAGLNERVSVLPDTDRVPYEERLARELQIIDELGFNQYFLIVADMIAFAKREDIRIGPGRGSAAGSLVAYVLGITDVDPIAYDLLFERFLNPERVQMPDIDIDIPDNRREDVLRYLHQRYGHEHVAQIITFSTMAMRAVVRDVARVFGLNPSQIDQLAKTLPREVGMTVADAYEQSQPFKNALIDLPVDGELLVETAKKLEGLPRNASLHAAGVVLSADAIEHIMPVQLGEDERLVTQLPKGPVERLGLLKMDFLALSNLNILDTALRAVAKVAPDFDINQIDLNDAQTLALFQKGQTNGVFQFESAGMKNMLKDLKPDSFEDIVAANALFRPGPSQNIGHFIARKHGQEAQDVPDASMAAILAPTYGIIVYQEQVMRVAEQFAGFSLGQADLLRRAMSKKDKQQLDAIKAQFVSGAEGMGHPRELAEQVYGYIETFAMYGFNRSHAVAYSKLAMQLAYLKAHYPAAFYKAVMNDAIAQRPKISAYLAEARSLGVEIVRPDINTSWQGYTVTDQGQLQMGLASISGLRRDFREVLITERQENGRYKSLDELVARLPTKYQKVETLEPLVYTGALDGFDTNRKKLVQSLKPIIDAVAFSAGSLDLLADVKPKEIVVEPYTDAEQLDLEFEYLGVYLSGHPLEAYLTLPHQDIANLSLNAPKATILGYVKGIKVIRTKKGDEMAFVDVMDLSGDLSVTVFPTLYKQIGSALENGRILQINGTVEAQRKGDGLQMIANQLQVAKLPEVGKGTWYLRLVAPEQIEQLNQLLPQHKGLNPVVVVNMMSGRKVRLDQRQWLADDDTTKKELIALLGAENAIFKV